MIPATIDLAEVAARFGERLHAAGVAVTPAMCGRFAAALSAAAPQRIDELYWLARVTLVVDRNDLAMFRRVFDEVFGGLVDVEDVERNPDARPAAAAPRRNRRRAGGRRTTTSKTARTSSLPPAPRNG